MRPSRRVPTPRAERCLAASEACDRRPVVLNQRCLFDRLLALGGDRFFARWKFLREHDSNGSPCGGVAATRTGLVLGDALLDVIGVANVIRAIGTAEHVHPEAHRQWLAGVV